MITVLKFYADWCAPCKVLSNTLKEKKGITNVNIEDNQELTIKYNIRNIPAMVFLKDDVVVHKMVGPITESEYDTIILEMTREL